MAARRRRGHRCQATPARATLARPAGGGRGRGDDDDRDPRSLQCQGQGRAGLAAAASELAPGLCGGGGLTMAHEELLEELRPSAFAIAYRMLGSVAEAEDVVQEALLRVHGALEEGQRIESPRAYVATVARRLAIDQLRSARARRESYVG